MPDDTSPQGREALHPPPERARSAQPASENRPRERPGRAAEIEIEDEDADPVVESGPGV